MAWTGMTSGVATFRPDGAIVKYFLPAGWKITWELDAYVGGQRRRNGIQRNPTPPLEVAAPITDKVK